MKDWNLADRIVNSPHSPLPIPQPPTPNPQLLTPNPLSMLDFEQQFPLVEPAFLITIVSETILRDSLITLLTQLKVRSYTISEVSGAGRQSRRSANPEASQTEIVETNLEIKAIASQEISNVILYALKEQQRDFAIFVYRQQVEALIEDAF